jgi:hypothetical protein
MRPKMHVHFSRPTFLGVACIFLLPLVQIAFLTQPSHVLAEGILCLGLSGYEAIRIEGLGNGAPG